VDECKPLPSTPSRVHMGTPSRSPDAPACAGGCSGVGAGAGRCAMACCTASGSSRRRGGGGGGGGALILRGCRSVSGPVWCEAVAAWEGWLWWWGVVMWGGVGCRRASRIVKLCAPGRGGVVVV
jgi:hypothetical protein